MSVAAVEGSGGFIIGASVAYSLRTVLRQHRLDHINHHALLGLQSAHRMSARMRVLLRVLRQRTPPDLPLARQPL